MNDAETKHFFTSKTFDAEFVCGDLHYEVRVQTPELCGCATREWSDWGPMHTCALEPDQTVHVTYRCVETGRVAEYAFHPPTIAVNSPALYAERQAHPYVLEIHDTARGLTLTALLDHDGAVDGAAVRRISADLDVNALVFNELDHAVAGAHQAAAE
jgi:hypothetical protein